MTEQYKATAITNWLIAGAPPHTDYNEIVADCARRLVASGMPLDQFSVYTTSINPLVPGRVTYWTASAGVKAMFVDGAALQGPVWVGTPAEVARRTGRFLRYRFGSAPEFDARDDMQRLCERGYVEYIAAPLHSAYTLWTNVAAFATKRAEGFSDADIAAMKRLQAPLARVVEAFVLHDGTVQVLSTYVGRDAGARVLAGNITRGDSEVISAVVLFIDLVGFTELSNAQPAELVIDTLNRFYDGVEPAIRANGGEILKFMGDGLLAIFPTTDDQTAQMAAAAAAMMALEEARASLQKVNAQTPERPHCSFRAALHLGDIHYGNIGSRSRLDFTVIGPTVNFASRMIDFGGEIGAETVCSDAFLELLPELSATPHQAELKGFSGASTVYALD